MLIDNSLTVNGLTSLESISAKQIAVSGNIADQGNMVDTDYVAIFENDNTATGDGVEIKLGKQHGALIGTNTYANISNPIFRDAVAGSKLIIWWSMIIQNILRVAPHINLKLLN